MKNKLVYIWRLILLSLTVLLMVCGCGKREADIEDADQFEGWVEENDAEFEEVSEAPQVVLETRKEAIRRESGQILVEGNIDTVKIAGEGYEMVAAAVADWTVQEEDSYAKMMEEYARSSEELVQQLGDYGETLRGYNVWYSVENTRLDSRVVSFCSAHTGYQGGISPESDYAGVSFDAQTGEKLEWEDLLTDKEAFWSKAADYCWKQLKEKENAEDWPGGEEINAGKWKEGDIEWYLDAAGITIIFDPYEISSDGMFVSLPYEEFSEWIKPEYVRGTYEGTAKLEVNYGALVSLDGKEGTPQKVTLWVDDRIDDSDKVYLQVGDNRQELEMASFVRSAYLICKEDGRVFLLLEVCMKSDGDMAYVYEITGGQIKQTAETEPDTGIWSGSINVDSVKLESSVNVLGTYPAMQDYEITLNGELKRISTEYRFETLAEYKVLTVLRPVPVIEDGREETLAKGTEIRIIGTDDAGVAYYRVEDSDETGEIHYTRAEDTDAILIDGIEDVEYFENLIYIK